ncbi:arginine/serine-rich protein 1 isoform X1 [Hippoglossus hippoglossus]|uniref:arginine/serine-rich protein 1 isoform X1 n=1 Tax=Hippoglossus hippoglossus TaxID=8267 RepID=UPI00148BE044|nr:arginine/serine-rich protein 1 isoform X1 [Hippoglossus hippoglossus]XP_035023454.1 arginine/serine-rich protein 1 isoform X1 [Hippoglossus stenolepis]
MAKGEGSHSEMATARQSDGISVIFDHNSPASSRSRSRSSGGSSGRHRVRSSRKTRHRSSSSSSVSSSSSCKLSSRPRSRSHPRCHRRSSRCRCDSHRRNGRHIGSPPRQIRADSRSYKQSSSQDRYSSRRNYRSHSRSTSHRHRNRKTEGQVGNKISRSPGRSHKSKSRSSGHSVSQTMDDKRELSAEKTNAMKILGVEKVDLPESVKPDLSEQLVESEESSSESETWVRQDPEKTVSQSSDEEPDDISNPKMSPLRKSISFSINNSVAKPTAAALSSAKVTPRVDSYESRKPYGHWIPVRSGKSSKARKHKLTKSH